MATTIELIKTGKVIELSLDHDLGNDYETGYDVLLWIEKQIKTGKSINRMIIHIHTSNPVGRRKTCLALDSINKSF